MASTDPEEADVVDPTDIFDGEYYIEDEAGWANADTDNADNRSTVSVDDLMGFSDIAEPAPPAKIEGDPSPRSVYGAAGRASTVAVTEIDPTLLESDMISLLYAELRNKRIDGHQIDSMNEFYRVGVSQIITNVFNISKTLKYERDEGGITEVTYAVNLSNVELAKPTTNDSHGRVTPLTPNMAHLRGIPYNLTIFVDILITLTATYANGGTKTETARITRHPIASIPCCVGSIVCATGDLTREGLKALHEDPNAAKGHFVLRNGNSWNIEASENLVNNTFHVYKVRHKNEEARGTFLSKPGDAFENSYQTIIKLLDSGAIVIEITTNKDEKLEIPFYIMFRALGMTVDRDITDHIVHGADNTDPTSITMKKLLERAFSVRDPEYDDVNNTLDSVTVLQFIANKFKEAADKKAAKKNINVQKYLLQSFIAKIDAIFFPHIGTIPADRIRKLRFLAHLIRELISVYIGISESTDRDSYQNKRVYAAGITFAKAFKTKFNLSVVLSIHRDMGRAIKSTPFDKIRLADVVYNAITKADLDKALVKAMAPSKKGANAAAKTTSRISTNQIYHKNDMNVIAAINTITTPNPPVGKSNERAMQMRQNQPSHLGYTCIQASPDTGEGVGRSKLLAISASISGSTSSERLKAVLREDPDVIREVPPADIQRRRLALIVVNGDPIGYCANSHEFAAKYRALRRPERGVIHPRTTIVWELRTRKVSFWTDYGRLHRPLTIVYNNIEEYDAAARAGKPIPFRQWIRLTSAHIRALERGMITVADLEAEGVIEYISPEELVNTYTARSLDHLRSLAGDVCHQFTHCDIPQAIMGPTALCSPASGHSNASRGTMQHNHRKQASSWYTLNFPFVHEKNTSFQHYIEQPLVSTFSDRITTPSGHNVIVALDCRAGNNAEDSIQVSSSAADRGYWAVNQYNFEKSELERGEQFGMQDITTTGGIKREAHYGKIDEKTHAARVGSVIVQNDVLIVKVVKMPKPDANGNRYKDSSTLNKRIEPSRVVSVVHANNNVADFIRVKISAYRPIGDGDKLSSRTGNKGIVSITTPACDMPYTEDGLVPDLLVNAHSIPTRMALNQMIECLLGAYAARIGSHIDATAFRSIDVRLAVQRLREIVPGKPGGIVANLKYAGHRRVYSGITGEPIDTMIFVGPTNYQRLEKFVIDEQYAIRSGPTSSLTHQPNQGKSANGGLRLGEMEKDTICVHGAMQVLHDKLWRDSDGTTTIICTNCGNPAIFNEKHGLLYCKLCLNNASFGRFNTTWSANLLHNRLTSMGVSPEYVLSENSYG